VSFRQQKEINLQTGIKGELKGLILWFTHWVKASVSHFFSQSHMNTGVGSIIRPLIPTSKRKCGLRPRAYLHASIEIEPPSTPSTGLSALAERVVKERRHRKFIERPPGSDKVN
jgi:hypothetical protein